MLSQIANAFSNGFTTKQIIDFILRQFPQHSDKIKSALKAGYTTDQILNFLTGGNKSLNNPSQQGMTEHEKSRKIDEERESKINKGALTGLGLGAASIAAPFASQVVNNALSRALPHSLQGVLDYSQQTTGDNPPIEPQQTTTSPLQSQEPNILSSQTPNPLGVNANNITQPIDNAQHEVNNLQELERQQALKKFTEKTKKPSILEEERERFEKGYGNNLDEDRRKDATIENARHLYDLWKQKETPHTFEKVLKANLKLNDDEANKLAKLIQEDDTPEKTPTIEKKSIAFSPQGVGEVKEIRNGKAIIEVNGKKHQVNEDELEASPFSEDEIANAYDDLMAKIPEKERSGFISWAGYDEDRNVLGFIPRGGKYEELHDITPEEAQRIKEGKGVARTTGENREGLWVTGEDTRGGVISQIIHDRRKKRKSEEEKQQKFNFELPKQEKKDVGMKPIFDEMGYARGLSRERERKKLLEERERKKNEKAKAKRKKQP